MKTVYEKGINDMPTGWTKENEWNYKTYCRWQGLLQRIYSEKKQEKCPSYIKVELCLEWHRLSKFVEDIVKIEGYDEEKYLNGELQLDKDIKSNNRNKEYSLNKCIFVTKKENISHSNKMRKGEKRNNNDQRGKNSKGRVAQYDKEGNLIKIWECARHAKEELGINHIDECCKFYEMNCDKEKWHDNHKNKYRYSAGNYIWKYYKE